MPSFYVDESGNKQEVILSVPERYFISKEDFWAGKTDSKTEIESTLYKQEG